MKIEVHGHVGFEETYGQAGKYGPERFVDADGKMRSRIGPYVPKIGGSGSGVAKFLAESRDPLVKVERMLERGIGRMLVTISPFYYLYFAEPEIGIPFSALQNDLLAKYCAAAPEHLFFAATLPMQDPAASVIELKRVAELGAKAVNVGTDDFGGLNLDDPAYWPLYAELVARDLPLFVHPYPLPMGDGREDNYNLSWVVGYIYQETVAFSHLTLGGVLDDFPDLRVYITHGGGFVPYQFGRIEAARETEQPGVRAKRPIRDYLGNFYFDILVHDVEARRFLFDFMGPDNLVVGSNVGGWDVADGFAMLDELDLSNDDREKIEWKNATHLFNL